MEFPMEIIEEILMRLPLKPLMKFSIVSNNWNDLISDHSFRKRYQNRNKVTMVLGRTTKVKSDVHIVVAGDSGTGKSSLIMTAITQIFPKNVPALLPPKKFCNDIFPDHVPITIVDTSSTMDRGKLAEAFMSADAVMLTYACDQPVTLEHLSTFWLPELRRLKVMVPVIVVGCKFDLLNNQQAALPLAQFMAPLREQFREIENFIECSAYRHMQVPEVFNYAQKPVLHPTSPLFDQEEQTLKPRCSRALKRIFILCDHDRDGAFSAKEFKGFQIMSFGEQLRPSELVSVKNAVSEIPEGVNDHGITLVGFLYIHAFFIHNGRTDFTWNVLRKFGYNDEIRLNEDHLLRPIQRAPDQSVELSNASLEFLRELFLLFDIDGDGALGPTELTDLFSTAPEFPWVESPSMDATERTASGGLTLDGFLSMWALMTLLDPIRSVENLTYVGYVGSPSSAIRITQRRHLDRENQQSERTVFQCFVFGPKCAGKSDLMTSFIGSSFTDDYNPTEVERFSVNSVDQVGGNKKTLVLREICEDDIQRLLSTEDSLASCDIAVFVHDSSDEKLWKRAVELLVKVATHGESSGYDVPCLIVATKPDLGEPSSTEILGALTRGIRKMGIKDPILISGNMGNLNSIFHNIVTAAENHNLRIPKTKYGKSPKQNSKLFKHSLMYALVGAAMAFVGVTAYRAFAAREDSTFK